MAGLSAPWEIERPLLLITLEAEISNALVAIRSSELVH